MKNFFSLKEFINNGKIDNSLSFDKFCKYDNKIINYNTLYDYIDILKYQSIPVILSDSEYLEYQYKPKLLSNKIYGSSEYYYIILIINDITSFREFDMKKINLIKSDILSNILSSIYTKEYKRIQ